MVSVQRATIELCMNLGGLLSTQEAIVALGHRLVRLVRFFRAKQPPGCTHKLDSCTLHASVSFLKEYTCSTLFKYSRKKAYKCVLFFGNSRI